MMRISSRSLATLSKNNKNIIFRITAGSTDSLPLEPYSGATSARTNVKSTTRWT